MCTHLSQTKCARGIIVRLIESATTLVSFKRKRNMYQRDARGVSGRDPLAPELGNGPPRRLASRFSPLFLNRFLGHSHVILRTLHKSTIHVALYPQSSFS